MAKSATSTHSSGRRRSLLIIGAGIAGLAAGCYGQMNGYDTRILEMHDRPGGLCTSWRRNGYIFDGCIHNLAGTSPKTTLRTVWDELGAFSGRRILNFDEFIRIESPEGQCLKVYTNLDKLEQHLLELAPEDKQIIREYIRAARKFAGLEFFSLPMLGAGAVLRVLPFVGALGKWGKDTMAQHARKFRNPFLRRAFSVIQYDMTGVPTMVNLQFLAGLHNGDLGWPEGGSLEFSKAIARRYLSLGGAVTYKARVEKILVENDEAIGVLLADGREVRGDVVISAADGHATIFDMLEGKYLSPAIVKYYERAPKSQEFALQVSFGVKLDLSKEPRLLVLMLDKPLTAAGSNMDRVDIEVFNSDTGLCPRGKAVVKLNLPASYEYWDNLLASSREDYEAAKKEAVHSLMPVLDHRFPGFTRAVEVVDVATPLTFGRFAGTWRGLQAWAAPGLASFLGGVSRTLPGLKNFYMAGQWAEGMIGISTAAISGRNLVKRLCKEDGKDFLTEKAV